MSSQLPIKVNQMLHFWLYKTSLPLVINHSNHVSQQQLKKFQWLGLKTFPSFKKHTWCRGIIPGMFYHITSDINIFNNLILLSQLNWDVWKTHLPFFRALLWELGELYALSWVFLLVLLTTSLHEVGIWGHLPPWLSVLFPHDDYVLPTLQRRKNKVSDL